MSRELPRTLRSLSPRSQVGVEAADYEVIVVDNGSADPVDSSLAAAFGGTIRIERIDDASPSPARAANAGLRLAEAELVGLIVDGARLASPGLLRGALRGARVADRAVVTAPAFHLGDVPHKRAAEVGYDQAAEDDLLAGCGWEDDGYRLFEISTLAGSSGRGLFGPMGESSSLFCSAEMWQELGGLDERFALPGGGLVNHDLYLRACALPDMELVVLLSEGTFHQYHGGASTSGRHSWDEMHADYEAIRGETHHPPSTSPVFVGHGVAAALPYIERSAHQALARIAAEGG